MLRVLNLAEATFDCTYGRGCDGVCCREGRPSVDAAEVARIDAVLPRVLPRLRPAARRAVTRQGWRSRRRRAGNEVVRVREGWCVFFASGGCTLHALGAEEGDRFRYKPVACSLFPLEEHPGAGWYVRQKGHRSEPWPLPCLDPTASTRPAAESLLEELALAQRLDAVDAARADQLATELAAEIRGSR